MEERREMRSGLPDILVQHLQASIAVSTLKAYSWHWNFFRKWCGERDLDPSTADLLIDNVICKGWGFFWIKGFYLKDTNSFYSSF